MKGQLALQQFQTKKPLEAKSENVVFAIESDVVRELNEKLRFANETVSNLMD